MFNAFYNLRLSEPWTFKLEDFIPSLAPQSRVPLPLQPQPNPAIVQQANPAVQQTTTMTSGLTPAEQALLSEEEKMIRLRNRGLA